jgi:predicted carbohydrate-binding protein with CBM5 and CBM33 domain
MQLRAHVIPFDPRTTAQLARRATFAAAQTAWAALDNTTKNLWNKSAIPERISGKNFFTRDYIANH